MKGTLALLVICLPLSAQAKVTSATVYPSHAQLVWEEQAQLKAGSGKLTLAGLPLAMQEHTLTAEIRGVQGASIQRVQVQQVEQAEVVAEKTRELQQQLRDVENSIGRQEDQIRAWNQQVNLMTGAAETPGELKASELEQLAQTVQRTTLDALSQVRAIRQGMIDDIAERDRLKRELAATQQNARATKTVTITYQAAQTGQATARLTYQTNGANWRSQYNARLSTDDNGETGTLTLEHLAVIRQNTGSDWNNVELTLSTANARQGTDIPPLVPWIVSPETPSLYRAKGALQTTMDSPQFEESRVAEPNAASVHNAGAYTQSFVVTSPVTIESDNSGQFVNVASHDVPVKVETRVFPAMDLTGFVHATGTFEAEITLPAGSVSLYRDGQSVGSSHMQTLASGEELAIGFGVNDRITAEKVSEEDQKGEQGVFKGEKYIRQVNRYDITNHHSQPVTVRVFDRLPVSRQDDLTVEALEITSPVTRNYQENKGILSWERVIKPGNTISLKAGFELRVPEDSELPFEFQ
ncbi:mucoidy inhibitor MuiA family protein [Marinobacter sp. CHS3-4]|uniref:mucoidy inhibitor MuiA family protein n=1 Tax=Marinobacter sp. CHS3-4 TaxID=3045174 RepID=UPI0024B52E3C|nr:mucoidy inhibitor MuiA family protein [Marinobacter sp. CHS3-4]MDI9245314.1 mucoidy inhibitor MuiA family protein [Marinobacter sp. CHS3-4]